MPVPDVRCLTSPAKSTSYKSLCKASNCLKCTFCSHLGHLELNCFLKNQIFASASPLSQPPSEVSHSASSASPAALSFVLKVESHLSWNADTGATAHMTFNHHWMRNLKPHRVPIRIANGLVVYSEGVGSVRFNPIVNGQEMPPLEFTDVLYVPALCSNLFYVLFLTLHHHFTVSIKGNTLDIIGSGIFQAKTGVSSSAFLLGETIPVKESASLSSTML